MTFDPDNRVVKLCAQGMDLEGQGNQGAAHQVFMQAWDEATSEVEKFIAAHYVARHQKSVADKLKWDETALQLALQMNDPAIKSALPSLYLNVAKCHEDLNNVKEAKTHYEMALSYADFLPEDGYGNLIRNGILGGLKRVQKE